MIRIILKGAIVLGALIGMTLGKELGFTLLIPSALAFFSYWLMKKIRSQTDETVLYAFAVQTELILWMLLGDITLKYYGWNVIEIVLVLIVLFWFVLKSNLWPTLTLLIYQCYCLKVSIDSNGPSNTDEFEKGLITAVVLRSYAGLRPSGWTV